MATIHVAFGKVGVRSDAGKAEVPIIASDSPRVAENVTSSGTTAYTAAQASGRGEFVEVTVPTSASVWIGVDAGAAGSLVGTAANGWRQDGASSRWYWLDGGDGLAITDVS